MFLQLIDSSALLLALCALYEFNIRLWGPRRLVAQITAGLIFGGISVVGMMHTVTVAPGVIFDARSVVQGMAGLFGGPLIGAVSAAVAASYRGWLGGGGATIGMIVILSSTLVGLGFRHLLQRQSRQATWFNFLVFGLVLHLINLGWFTQLPSQHLSAVFSTLALPYLVVLTPATALVAVLLHDLQEQRLAKVALARSEALQRAITDASPDLLMVMNEEGRYLQVISPDERLLYDRPEQVVGRHVTEVLPHESAQKFMQFIRQTLKAGTTQIIEYELQTLGGPHVFEGRAHRLEHEIDGKQAIVFVARDITQRVRDEEERRIAAVAFQSSQPMLVADAQTRILRANPAFLELLGYAESEVLGQPTRILRSGQQDDMFYAAMWASIAHKGSWEGELWDRDRNGQLIPLWTSITAVKNAGGQVTHYVATLRDITASKRKQQEIEALAFYDALTLLPNRRLFLDRLDRALALARRTSQGGALMYLDLDNFKRINDSHGHHHGDLLLQQVAMRLSRSVRETDTVARLGGDEFVILLENLPREPVEATREARHIADKALKSLSQAYDLDGLPYHSSGSIGIAMFGPHEVPVDVLMRQADEAMYRAKKAGKNGLVLHGESDAVRVSLSAQEIND